MGLFEALLLAASLGCTAVLAAPQGPFSGNAPSSVSSLPYNGAPTSRPRPPHMLSSQSHFNVPPPSSLPVAHGSATPGAVTAYTSPAYQPPHGPPTSGMPQPPHSPPASPPHWTSPTPPTTTTPTPTPTPPPSSSNNGGLLIDTGAPPTAIRTYYIEGHPIVAGASATVVGGTTYSVASSGTGRLFVDGTLTRVSDAILVDGTATVTAGTSGVAPAASSGAAVGSGRTTGGAGRGTEVGWDALLGGVVLGVGAVGGGVWL